MNPFILAYNFFQAHKVLFYAFFAGVVIVLALLASRIRLEENIMQMLPESRDNAGLNSLFQNSRFTDRIMVTVSAQDTTTITNPDSLVELADRFVARLQQEQGAFIASVDHTARQEEVSGLLEVIDNNLPLFLEEKDYRYIDSIISPEGLKKQLEYNYATLTGPAGIALKKYIVNDPLGLNFIGYKKLQALQIDESLELYNEHFLSKDHKRLVLFINPKYPSSETAKNAEFFEGVDKLVQELSQGSPYAITYFGAPAVAAGNAKQIRQDSLITTSVTLLLLLVITSLFFRRFTAPLLMMLPVAFGALFALAGIYLVKGEISIIAVGAGSVVLGIAINYSLHFLTQYRFTPDTREVIKEMAFPMTIGSITTVCGFLLLQFVKAPVLQDLGLFAALSLIGAAISTLLFLPHFLKGNPSGRKHGEGNPRIKKLVEKLPGNKLLVGAMILLTPFFLYYAGQVQFESDLYKINYMSPQLRHAEESFNNISSFYQKSIFVVAKGKTLDEALLKNETIKPAIDRLKRNGDIRSYADVSGFLLSEKEQEARISRWNAYWTPEKKAQVLKNLTSEGQKYGFNYSAFMPFETLVNKPFSVMSAENANAFKEALLKNFIEEQNGEVRVISLLKASPGKSANVYKELAAYPDIVVFDRQYITDTLVKIVSDDFHFIAIFSSLLVLLALLLSYGRFELALISFIPMVVSWIWILGLMALLDIKFNIINIILSTFVFALGDDYCIFTMDGLQQRYARGEKHVSAIRTSILLSAITTILGLGILIFAEHPALKSIAIVSVIGIGCVWLVSQTLQPLLFNIMITSRAKKGLRPFTLWTLAKTVFAFSYFLLGALLLTITGFVLTRLIPFNRNRMKYIYHWLLCKFTASMVYIMANVKKRIINTHREKFRTPAVIIANHQSFLDILSTIMLHPKLVLLTKSWVWKSPVMGAVVRMADYYPTPEGAENSIHKLAEKVKQGYSVVIFPEGTRSTDGTIGRFHKGAFYLAEQLQMDILPVILHGTGHCMAKGDFLLKDEQITIKFLPRIKPGDTSFGATYSERAKMIGRYFRNEYDQLAEEIETPDYFRNTLVSNYLYKGPILEWYMKVKIKLEKNYSIFDKILPKQGKIYDIGCGYGFMSYMLGYTSGARIIKGLDYDEEKIDVAKTGYAKGRNVCFSYGNALDYELGPCDGIVISDVLHYLQPEEQVFLLEKCIDKLNENGKLVIRDGIKELKKRHKKTKLTELFSTRIIKFNKTSDAGLSFISADLIYGIAGKHNMEVERIDNTKFTSNIIFVLNKR